MVRRKSTPLRERFQRFPASQRAAWALSFAAEPATPRTPRVSILRVRPVDR